jgi:hypothetical protein
MSAPLKSDRAARRPVLAGWRPHRQTPTGGSIYTSVGSAVSSASSTSMPEYRTVLSSLV